MADDSFDEFGEPNDDVLRACEDAEGRASMAAHPAIDTPQPNASPCTPKQVQPRIMAITM